jgi:UDP-N-acetylmuramoyl-L-alanyl-D-glutamate--2,6-diaminopimelate ligase
MKRQIDMRLSELLKDIVTIPADVDREISHLILDSRKVQHHDLFLAIKGTQVDGRRFIPQAIAAGASAVLLDADAPLEAIRYEQSVPLIPVFQLQHQLGKIGAGFYHEPAKQLKMFGVTGTNGKTSCTHFIAQILQALKIPSGVIGTLGSGMVGALGEAGLTTPDAITLQATLRNLIDQGAKAVAMEVSSHSIDQGRVNDVAFAAGIFTNLTQDHLDYHGTMEAYANVKRSFLANWPIKHLILNADDVYGEEWIREFAPEKSVYAFSVSPPTSLVARGIEGLVYAEQVEMTLSGVNAKVYSPWGESHLSLPLIGQFNLSNALAVLTALCAVGFSFEDVIRELSRLKSVPGRMQRLGGNGAPLVVVDYAHTPDALEKVLQALRLHVQGKLYCVVGCGGDRDPGKRPIMGEIAERLSDGLIITNDNPRHEDPAEIASQITKGLANPLRATIILDRSKAIEKSIQLATSADCILIAGKGAERYQQIGDEKFPFDDVEQATYFLNKTTRTADVPRLDRGVQ